MFTQFREENSTDMVGLLEGERSGICKSEQINVKMKLSAFCTTVDGPYFK